METSFYEPMTGDRYRSTRLTTGPWDPRLQHGGPPAALLGRAIERGAGAMRVRRMTVELLRPIPIEPLEVRVDVVRAGKTVSWLAGSLTCGGKEVARASAVAIRTTELDLPEHPRPSPSLPPVAEAYAFEFPFFRTEIGYQTAVDLRVAKGAWSEGPCGAWLRMKAGLVEGEAWSPLCRTLAAVDAGNGVSITLPLDRFTFINPDLTLHLHREPEGEWIGLDATTTPEPDGTGLAETRVHDERGPIGRSLQSLIVSERA